MICRIIHNPDINLHKITFSDHGVRKWIHKGRRVGRPMENLVEDTVKELWDHLTNEISKQYIYTI